MVYRKTIMNLLILTIGLRVDGGAMKGHRLDNETDW
jgi:hypothetical protein